MTNSEKFKKVFGIEISELSKDFWSKEYVDPDNKFKFEMGQCVIDKRDEKERKTRYRIINRYFSYRNSKYYECVEMYTKGRKRVRHIIEEALILYEDTK